MNGTRPGITGDGPMNGERGDTEQWVFPKITLTKLEKKLLIATVVQLGVLTMFHTHLYQFGGVFYKQCQGGPIGLRGTCCIARLTMNDWDRKWVERLAENLIQLEDAARYMDDIRAFLYPIRLGWRWLGNGLYYCKMWEDEERNLGLTPLDKTSSVLLDTMGDVHGFLRFTKEKAMDFQDNKLPTLDMKIWIAKDNIVHYEFFEKSMSSNQVVQLESALPENSKISSLSMEVVRRLLNTSEAVDNVSRLSIIDKFAQKLTNSGYKVEQTRKIILNGLKCYQKKLEKARNGGAKIHRSGKSTRKGRFTKKLLEKTNWFRGGKKENSGMSIFTLDDSKEEEIVTEEEYAESSDGEPHGVDLTELEESNTRKKKTDKAQRITAVMFVEQTLKGALAKKLRDLEIKLANITGYKFKIVAKS